MPVGQRAAKALATEFGSDRMWGLKELPLPEPVSLLPATPGWLAVAGILLAIAAWCGVRIWRRWQRGLYRREALRQLERIGAEAAALAELPELLRGTALLAFPREEVASLRGRAWVDWLNANGGRFEPSDSEWLDRLPYVADAAAALAPEVAARLVMASRHWVRRHDARL